MENNRIAFNQHIWHFNGLGRELLSKQLVHHVDSVLKETAVYPITLGQHNEQAQVHVSPTANFPLPPISTFGSYDVRMSTAPKRIRKMPVTRNVIFMQNLK
jgi:hypothetical protein